MMQPSASTLDAVTGAFGFAGGAIARELLTRGRLVRTLTNRHPAPDPFGGAIDIQPLHFDNPTALSDALSGVDVLYNTYWVRLDRPPRSSFAQAVANSARLFWAARAAGVRRIVHLSVTNPDPQSHLGYFRGKAEVESALRSCGVPWTILRPALIFDREEILISNNVWLLRRFPAFGLFGDGAYRVQPILRGDLARLAADAADGEPGAIIDAIGPETFTFRQLVELLARALGKRRLIVPIPPSAALGFSRLMGCFTRDILIVRQEIEGLMEERLWTRSPPVAPTRFSEWIARNIDHLGRVYANDRARRPAG